MADKDISEKRDNKNKKEPANVLQRVAAFFIRIGKSLKNFLISLKAELKRVIWPDKKRLIQNTATVLAICLCAAVILFVVDQFLSVVLNGVGFYEPKETTVATTVTTTATVSETTAGETTVAATTAGTTAAETTGTTKAAG